MTRIQRQRGMLHFISHRWVALIAIGGWLLLGNLREVQADGDAPQPPIPSAAQPAADEKKPPATEGDKATTNEMKVSAAEQLEFQQAKISAEMAELEHRMFQLSEVLKPLEPDNSSRLTLGVKLAREELILHQMKAIQKQLRAASLAESVIEQKQLLAKLERLEQLLLSSDLDFQMRLERLRQIREALRRLDRAIREEDREQQLSAEANVKVERMAEAEKKSATIQQSIESETDQAAREELRKSLAESQDEAKKLKAELSAERFAAMVEDQAGNRQSTDGITELVRGIGNSGTEALGELIKAGGSMTNAEKELHDRQALPAAKQQKLALDSLKYAREKLVAEAQRLQEQLRGEVKKRTVEGLALMLEQQVMVREATESLSKRVAQGSRQAQASVAGLANSESKIVALANELINLVEETEFGIALPAALHVVRDEMEAVQNSLGKSEADATVIASEKQIEADLEGLLDAMKQMPATGKGEGGGTGGGSAEDQEREINRMIAELKTIRLLETRLQQDTTVADHSRENAPAVLPALRKQIETLTGRQEDVRDVTERLATERDMNEP